MFMSNHIVGAWQYDFNHLKDLHDIQDKHNLQDKEDPTEQELQFHDELHKGLGSEC